MGGKIVDQRLIDFGRHRQLDAGIGIARGFTERGAITLRLLHPGLGIGQHVIDDTTNLAIAERYFANLGVRIEHQGPIQKI